MAIVVTPESVWSEVTTPAPDDAADMSTFLGPNQALANRDQFLRDAIEDETLARVGLENRTKAYLRNSGHPDIYEIYGEWTYVVPIFGGVPNHHDLSLPTAGLIGDMTAASPYNTAGLAASPHISQVGPTFVPDNISYCWKQRTTALMLPGPSVTWTVTPPVGSRIHKIGFVMKGAIGHTDWPFYTPVLQLYSSNGAGSAAYITQTSAIDRGYLPGYELPQYIFSPTLAGGGHLVTKLSRYHLSFTGESYLNAVAGLQLFDVFMTLTPPAENI